MDLEEAFEKSKITVVTTSTYGRTPPKVTPAEMNAFQAQVEEADVIFPSQQAEEEEEDLCPTCAVPEAVREEDAKHPMGWVCSICGCGWPVVEATTIVEVDAAQEEVDELEEDLHSALELLEAAQTLMIDFRRNPKLIQKMGWKLEQEFNALEQDVNQFLDEWINI